MTDKINKSEEEWAAELDEDQFAVLRRGATEAPFSGKLLENKEAGLYRCAGCGAVLFDSTAKFDSGSGWPSFFKPAEGGEITEKKDLSHGMVRTEILCGNCQGHLGHVFPDGPNPTGLRYCVNSLALDFDAEAEKDD